MKIIFFGTPDFAVPALRELIKNKYDIQVVITQPDKPLGKNKKLTPPPIKVFAEQNNLKIIQPETLKSEDFFEDFKKLNSDMCVVAAYGKIIPKKYLELLKYGFINVHPSLLPKYRGPSPIQTAILNGDTETGVTIILVDEKMDHGAVLANSKYQIPNDKYFKEVCKDLAEMGAKLIIEIIPEYISGKIKPQEQDHSEATFTKIIETKDGEIKREDSAGLAYNKVRALNPEPGVYIVADGKRLKILKASLAIEAFVLSLGRGDINSEYPLLKLKGGFLILEKVQLEGGREMDGRDFRRGHPNFLNNF